MAYGASSLRARTDDADAYLNVALDVALRFRLRPDLELGATMSGSVARTRGYAAFLIDLRYRFFAERPWNPFAFAGVGTAGWFPESGWQPFARVGIGLERRFESWAFSADARLARVGGDSSMPAGNVAATLEHYGAWDASMSVAAIYYWGRGRPSRRVTP